MKIIRACYSPLLDIAQAMAGNIYKKMLLTKSFPAQRVIVTSEPSLTSRIVSIIKCISADPATHSILMVDHPGFQLVDAHNEYLNGNMIPVVTWTGGKPPYRFWVSYRPTGGTSDDDILGTRIVNLAPEFLKATIGPDIYTMEGIITKNIDYWEDGWWADDLNGDIPQDEIGVVIEDSSDPPMQIFAPFTPLETDPNYNKYSGAGHSYGPDTWCLCPFEFILNSAITYGEDITWLSEPRGRVPGTNDEVAGTFGVYTDRECTQVANLTLPNAGSYLLFVQFVPNDTTHLRANVKEQTVTVAQAAQEALSIEFRRYFSAYSPYVSTVGDIDGSNVFVYNTASGNPITFWTFPAGAAAFSPNNIAATYNGIDEDGVPRNNQYGTKYTWVMSGTITFYARQAGSANYTESPLWSQEIYVSIKGTRRVHPMRGGGVGGGTIGTVNFYPERHVMVGGGVGGGLIATAQAKTHIMSGGGVGGGTILVSQGKQDQIIDSIYFYDATLAGYPLVTVEELVTRNTQQKLYVVASCTSALPISFQVNGTADTTYGSATYISSGTWGGVFYNYPHTYFYLQYTTGPIYIVARQVGNEYWNPTPDLWETIIPASKEVLTVIIVTWPGQYFTVDNNNANCQFVLSRDVLCAVTTSSPNMVVAGRGLSTYDAYHQCTYVNFRCSVAGSYTATFSVTNNPLYADFSYTISMTVPGAPAKKLNSISGFPSYFIANASGSAYFNQIGGIRLASMFRSSDGGALINDSTAVTGTNKVHYVQEPIPGIQGTTTVTFTLGATPFFGGSPRYTSSTVYMSRFDGDCTLRIQHPGNIYYYPFDATYLLTSTGAKVVIPPADPPPETGGSWHITYYQCAAPVLFKIYDPMNSGNSVYGTWRIGAAINGSSTINAYVTHGFNDSYYHPSHDADYACTVLGITALQFTTYFIVPTGWVSNNDLTGIIWPHHVLQIEYYY